MSKLKTKIRKIKKCVRSMIYSPLWMSDKKFSQWLEGNNKKEINLSQPFDSEKQAVDSHE